MMKKIYPFLQLNRLRVLKAGKAVYDQEFHAGINIIRGDNNRGKSTIADFIFFALGGEFDAWKGAAKRCSIVQAEIETPRGIISIHRKTDSKQAAVLLYFGRLEAALEAPLSYWNEYPIRRSKLAQESFTTVLFRSMHIPEAQSEGASNITMHQLQRLIYSDQRTPAPRLFRFEPFDTSNIRSAVGDLALGVNGYDLYDANLNLREKQKELSAVEGKLASLLETFKFSGQLGSEKQIDGKLTELVAEYDRISDEVGRVGEQEFDAGDDTFFKDREAARKKIARVKADLSKTERSISDTEYDITDIEKFSEHLAELWEKIGIAESQLIALGDVVFSHCPNCLKPLKKPSSHECCYLCGEELDAEEERSRYNMVRLDTEIQLRETKQLLSEKQVTLRNAKRLKKEKVSELRQLTTEFKNDFDISSSPRERYLSTRYVRLGHIDAEVKYLNG